MMKTLNGKSMHLNLVMLDLLWFTEQFQGLSKDLWLFLLSIQLESGHFSFLRDKLLSVQFLKNFQHIVKVFIYIYIKWDIKLNQIVQISHSIIKSENINQNNGISYWLLVRKNKAQELLILDQEIMKELVKKELMKFMNFSNHYCQENQMNMRNFTKKLGIQKTSKLEHAAKEMILITKKKN